MPPSVGLDRRMPVISVPFSTRPTVPHPVFRVPDRIILPRFTHDVETVRAMAAMDIREILCANSIRALSPADANLQASGESHRG